MANRRKEKKDSFQGIADECNTFLNRKRQAESAPKEKKIVAGAKRQKTAVVGSYL